MDPRIAPLADLYKINTGLVNKVLKDVSGEDLHKRINDSGNSLHWIIGHIASSRQYVGNLIGADCEFEKADLFNGGSPIKDPSSYPSMDEVISAFDSVSGKLLKRLGELTDKDLSKKPADRFPIDDDTNLGAIAFMSLHESYHVGQLSYIRKQLGYEGLTG